MFHHVSHLKVITLTLECAMRDELHGTCHAETRGFDLDELRAWMHRRRGSTGQSANASRLRANSDAAAAERGATARRGNPFMTGRYARRSSEDYASGNVT